MNYPVRAAETDHTIFPGSLELTAGVDDSFVRVRRSPPAAQRILID